MLSDKRMSISIYSKLVWLTCKCALVVADAFLLLMPSFASAQMNRYSLDSDAGITWKVKAQQEIGADSLKLVKTGYNTLDWVRGVVPGTVFSAYVEAKLEKDPNFADNIYKVDKKKYDRNYWYRTSFKMPEALDKGKNIWLNMNGVNRKAEVYFNGIHLGNLDGFMQRGKFEISRYVVKGAENILAVLVYCPQLPIANYASPTYISSSSWDWMPYVPGLESGITDKVYLSTTADVSISDPWIRTKLDVKQKAALELQVELNNASPQKQKGILTGLIQPGNIIFSQEIDLEGYQQKQVLLDTGRFKQLIIEHPRLWWPNGYGEPHLYTCDLKFSIDTITSDSRKITFGIKEYSYDTIGNVFHISINGKRIFVKGGNWGMSEYMLRCHGAEYDLKVKLHKEMNLNMIRNWIGSTTDDEFYQACDKYGIMVWDDFWLNSHNNLPRDIFAFNLNAVEKIKRLRNHPSIAVWCGDNESWPLPPLNGWLAENVKTFDGGDRWYQANSHDVALTGSGPWANFDPQWYFSKYPNGFGGVKGWGMRTEIGTAVFTTFESFKKFMPEESWWPRNEMWDKHFFGKSAANADPDRYEKSIGEHYGKATGIADFCLKAQLLNIETNKALYEGWLHHMWDDASGVMTWMSQSAYPSLVWQTYDYYYNLNGAYWGVKKACEPLHIQWSYADNSVKVVNTTSGDFNHLIAEANVYDLTGKKTAIGKSAVINSKSNSTTDCFKLNFNTDNLAYRKSAYASSSAVEGAIADITDGNTASRWSSDYKDNQWINVDLGTVIQFSAIVLRWEVAYATDYKIQVSADRSVWKDIYSNTTAKGGTEYLNFSPLKARYVRMLGLKRATEYGFSLYELEVYEKHQSETPEVQLLQLLLKDQRAKIQSENLYWRSNKNNDYTPLNTLLPVQLHTSYKMTKQEGKIHIQARVENKSETIAFAVDLQVLDAAGQSILPAIMDDNYFTLLSGDVKMVNIEFDQSLLKDGKVSLQSVPYNNRKR